MDQAAARGSTPALGQASTTTSMLTFVIGENLDQLLLFLHCLFTLGTVMTVFYCFSDRSVFDDEGFGNIFDGFTVDGHLQEVSTQAVMELIRKVSCESNNIGSGFVEIGAQDVQDYHIPRPDPIAQKTNHGNFVFEIE